MKAEVTALEEMFNILTIEDKKLCKYHCFGQNN